MLPHKIFALVFSGFDDCIHGKTENDQHTKFRVTPEM